MLYRHMRLSDADNLYEVVDLKALDIHGDNLEKFRAEWQRILMCLRHPPSKSELESALRRRLDQSAQFKI